MELDDAAPEEVPMAWYFTKENVFHENIKYFRFLGMLVKNPVIIIIRTCFQSFIIAGCFLHFITAKRSKGYATDFLDDCAIIIAGSGMNFNIFSIMANLDEILSLVRKLNVFKLFGEPINYAKHKRNLWWFFVCYKYFVYFGTTYYIYLAIRYKPKCIEEQIRDGKERVCGLLSQTYHVKGLENSPYTEIVMTLQAISVVMSTHSTAAIYTFIFIICEHIVIRIDHLKFMLEKIRDIHDAKMKRDHLANCIIYHNDIISLTDHINRCFSTILFAAISVDTLIVGILTVQIMINASLPVIMHVIAWIGTLFLLSFTGQRVYNKAVSLQDCIYNLCWYEESISLQKDLNFIMFRSQKPLVLKTGDFGIMYFPTYLNVMKTSYSYVAVLQQTM